MDDHAIRAKTITGPGFTPKLETKHAPEQISSLSPDGSFAGYASLFGVIDMGQDQVMPGAFRESLLKRGPAGVKMLWQHQASQPIGSWQSIAEDARGLKVAGRLNLAVARAREILALMRDGALDGLSIGFKTEKSVKDKASGVRRLTRLDLWEISIVTFPMLPEARISAVKRAPHSARNPLPAGDLAAKIRHAANLLR